jgi:hypothetical protein
VRTMPADRFADLLAAYLAADHDRVAQLLTS